MYPKYRLAYYFKYGANIDKILDGVSTDKFIEEQYNSQQTINAFSHMMTLDEVKCELVSLLPAINSNELELFIVKNHSLHMNYNNPPVVFRVNGKVKLNNIYRFLLTKGVDNG